VAPDPSITDMVAQYLAQQQIQLEAARRDAGQFYLIRLQK
jgi:hypothetical protein